MSIKATNARLFALVCVFFGGLGQGIVNPRLPDFLSGAGHALALASGFSAALLYGGIFLASFFYGAWADRGAVFRMLGLGLFAYAAILLGFSYAHGLILIFSLRFLEGLALSAVFVSTDYILGHASTNEDRGRWLSYHGASLSLGLLFGPIFLLVSPSTGLCLRAVSLFVALIAIVAFRSKVPPLHSLLSNAKFALTPLLLGALYGFLEAGLVAVLAVLIQAEFFVKVEYCFLAIILSAALSSLFWGILIDKIGPRQVLFFIEALLSVGALFLLLEKGWLAPNVRAYSACILFGVVAGGIFPAAFTWLLEGLPANAYGRASAAFTRAYGLGSLVGPLVIGAATQFFGGSGFFSVLVVVGAAGTLVTASKLKEARAK